MKDRGGKFANFQIERNRYVTRVTRPELRGRNRVPWFKYLLRLLLVGSRCLVQLLLGSSLCNDEDVATLLPIATNYMDISFPGQPSQEQ